VSAVEPNQLSQEIAPRLERLKSPIGPHAIGIRLREPWRYGDAIQVDGSPVAVRWCPSELTIREALLDASSTDPVVILTPLPDRDLGLDILSRLDSGRLGRLKPWEGLKNAFKARRLDPRVRRSAWLADILLKNLPEGGYTPATGGVLQRSRVLKEVFRAALHWKEPVIDAVSILQWGQERSSLKAWNELPEEARADLTQWVAEESGELPAHLLRCFQDGPGLLVVGLALEVSLGNEAATGRLESYINGRSVEKTLGLAWTQAALETLRNFDSASVRAVCGDVDELLKDLKLEDDAHASRVSPLGFDQRIERLAERLKRELGKPSKEGVRKLWENCKHVLAHRNASGQAEQFRTRRMEMAVRLAIWLREDPPELPTTLAQLAVEYLKYDAFVDWARTRLIDGDPSPSLASAYNKAAQMARERQATRSKAFADLLADCDANPAGLLKVEELLQQVVVPLRTQTGQPVLLVVMDGMSLPVFHEMAADLSENIGWRPLAPVDGTPLGPALAALPSTTAASRSSLLCGRLGAKHHEETKGFASALQELHGSPRPKLFLKGELATAGNAELAPAFLTAIHSDAPCIGCVVNAIDDSLTKNDQTLVPWEVKHVPLLERIIAAAKSAGRLLVITSDHGHLLEQDAEQRDSDTDGRYRHQGTQGLAEDERLISGDRVLNSEKKLVSSYREDVRYSGKQTGYHGGIHPLEMLVPVGIFGQTEPEGWQEHVIAPPAWWDEPSQSGPPLPSSKPAKAKTPGAKTTASKPTKTPVETGNLFEHAAEKQDSLFNRLMASGIMDEQRAIHTRAATELNLKRLGVLLDALLLHGGTANTAALARDLKLSEGRLVRFISAVAPLLSVDGYAALELERTSKTVRLNQRRLEEQFDLS